MKSIKVIFILNSNSRHGGASKAILHLLDGLILKGVTPFVVLPQHGGLCDDLKSRKISYFVTPYFHSVYPPLRTIRNSIALIPRLLRTLYLNYKATKKIITYIEDIKPDIIHSNVGPIDVGFKTAKQLKIPHVWHIREYQDLDFNMHFFPSKSCFIKTLQSNNNYPVAITKGIFNYFNMKKNAQVIYDGVLKMSDTAFVAKKENYFLFAGRLEENKGIGHLIRAFADFTKNISDYKLYIAGDTTNTNYKEELAALVKEHHLGEYVVFLGMRDDVCDLMAHAIALVVPSFHEGFGFITVEAMFNGCLVIGNNSAGTQEILASENLGLLYSGHDELVTAMQTLVEKGIESYFPMLMKAQERAVALYSQERHVDAIYNLYNEIIKIQTNTML